MRLSADCEDVDFSGLSLEARILFDNQFVNDVRSADEENGFILRVARDILGQPTLCACGETLMTELKFGDVNIILPKHIH